MAGQIGEQVAEQIAVGQARLRWSCRRGMRELDLMLLAWLDQGYPNATEVQRDGFKRLLGESDQDLYDWLMHNAAPTDREFHDVIERIRSTAAA